MTFTPEQLELINQGRRRLQESQQQPEQQPNTEQLFALGRQKLQESQQVDEQQPVNQQEFSQLPFLEKLRQIPEKFGELKGEDFVNELFGQQESPFEQGLSVALREVGAPLAGLPSDILQGTENLSMGVTSALQQQLGLPTIDQIEEETGRARIEQPLTTENLQKWFDDITDNRFKELPEDVKVASDITRDAALMMLPLGPIKGQNFLRSIGTSIFSNLGATGLVDAGVVDEKNKDMTKFGLMFMSNFIRPFSIKKSAVNFLNKAENAVKGKIVTDPQAAGILKKTTNNLKRAGGLEVNPRAVNFVEGLVNDVESGTFEGDFITKSVRNLNKLIRKVGFSSDEGRALGEVRKGLQGIAENIGVNNPEFITNWNEGNMLFQAANTKNFVQEWALKKIPIPFLRKAPLELLSLLGLKLAGGKFLPAIIPANMMANSMTRLAKFPAVQRLYMNLIKQAGKDNVTGATKTFNQLSKAFEQTKDKG